MQQAIEYFVRLIKTVIQDLQQYVCINNNMFVLLVLRFFWRSLQIENATIFAYRIYLFFYPTFRTFYKSLGPTQP